MPILNLSIDEISNAAAYLGDRTKKELFRLKAGGHLETTAEIAAELSLLDLSRPPAPTADDFAQAVQEHIDGVARSKGYADGQAVAGYATSTVPAWQAQAQAFVAWRDAVWLGAYKTLGDVQAGQIEAPTIEGLIQGLPTIAWPEE